MRQDRSGGGFVCSSRCALLLPTGSGEGPQGFSGLARRAFFPRATIWAKLGRLAVGLDGNLAQVIDGIVDRSKYARMFRYPGDQVVPTREDVLEALARATLAFDDVRRRI